MLAAAVTDSATMLRRNLKHMRRYPSMTLMLIGQPIVFLLLFVYVFVATMGAGLTGPGGGRTEYLAYITPAILLMTVASVALSTAISVATDMTEGIVARFRTMAIARVSLLALTWLTVALGLVSKSLETASNLPMFLVLLPFRGSGFVPTDSMPAGLRWFANYQPFTPVIDPLRGLFTGTAAGGSAALAIAWSAVITAGSYLWAKHLFNRHTAR